MPECPELQRNDNPPTPVLRRAPVLLDSHGNPMGALREKVTFVGDIPPHADSGTRDVNLHRSISHRISRVATTTLGRSLSASLRRSRSTGQTRSRVQGGEVVHPGAGDVRIRKVHCEDDSTHPVSAPRLVADARASRLETAFASVNDGRYHSAHAHGPAMQTDQQHGKSSIAEIPVPALLQQGVPMTKVSAKSQKSYIFKLDADQGQIIWESKKLRISTCVLVG